MDIKSLATRLFEYHEDTIKLTKSEDGFWIAGKLTAADKLYPHIPPSIVDKDNLTQNQLSQVWKELLTLCRKELSERKIPEELENTTLGRERNSGEIFVFEEGHITDRKFLGFQKQYPKASALMLETAFEFVAEYNPHKPERWMDKIDDPHFRTQQITHYNLYSIPTWMRHPKPETLNVSHVNDFLVPFFDHLFPVEKSRNYVKWWLYKLIHGRCQDCLVLVGPRGSGKSLLTSLATALVGVQNYEKAGKRLLAKEFNSEFENSKLVAFEEYKVTSEGYEVIKRYMDTKIAVEGKGQDIRQITNHASVILTNNSTKKVYCLADERRYSCPEPTEVDLSDVWSEDKIDLFEQMLLHDEEFHLTTAYWIIKEVEDTPISFPKNKPYKDTPVFWDLVYQSKHPAWKAILKLLETKSTFNVEEVTWRGAHGKRITDEMIDEWHKQEVSERKRRNIHPYELLETVVEDEQVNYKNLLLNNEIKHTTEEGEGLR